eukprot:gene17848-19631_t
MRATIQRVMLANVSVDGEIISSIGKGLCILLGISRDDTAKDVEYMVRKILNLRLFDGEGKRWRKSVIDSGLEVLCISQFTLYGILKGNKPDFHLAMDGEKSKLMYEEFLSSMQKGYSSEKVKDGKFAAYMQVTLQNDGPVTINIDSRKGSEQA